MLDAQKAPEHRKVLRAAHARAVRALKRKERKDAHLYSRQESADILGVNLTEFRRLEERGFLEPQYFDSTNRRAYYELPYLVKKKGERVRFVESNRLRRPKKIAEEVANEKVSHPPRIHLAYRGTHAARAFEGFKLGLGLAEIVIKYAIPPDIVEHLFVVWSRLHKVIVLTEEEIKRIEASGIEGTWPVSGGAELVDNLILTMRAHEPCKRCKGKHRQPRTICAPCVVEIQEKMLEQSQEGREEDFSGVLDQAVETMRVVTQAVAPEPARSRSQPQSRRSKGPKPAVLEPSELSSLHDDPREPSP